jgi:hypothetical protein
LRAHPHNKRNRVGNRSIAGRATGRPLGIVVSVRPSAWLTG